MGEIENSDRARQRGPVPGMEVNAAAYAAVEAPMASLRTALLGMPTTAFADAVEGGPGPVVRAVVESLNTLMTAADWRCTEAPPPEPIAVVSGPTGALIHQCAHAKPHCWDADFNPISC